MKEVKGLCKAGNLDMGDVFDFLLKHLNTAHAQIRLSTIQVCFTLFSLWGEGGVVAMAT